MPSCVRDIVKMDLGYLPVTLVLRVGGYLLEKAKALRGLVGAVLLLMPCRLRAELFCGFCDRLLRLLERRTGLGYGV
ncbi:hypothetical protein CCR82_05040 [Halochromatium salexigens]|uniref:Uncharacterized protein n=1 Tax=Halochromatium salexigens TaxID=49447 RepID=A0AAJ0XEK1_HALSE|nr:hypothetical protein [Halochromatium salexigens]